MSIETTPPVASNLPQVEHERADIRLCITVKRNPQTGQTKAYINQLDVTNYDGLISDVTLFLEDFDMRYGVNKIVNASVLHASKVAQ